MDPYKSFFEFQLPVPVSATIASFTGRIRDIAEDASHSITVAISGNSVEPVVGVGDEIPKADRPVHSDTMRCNICSNFFSILPYSLHLSRDKVDHG